MNSNFSGLLMAFLFFLSFSHTALRAQISSPEVYVYLYRVNGELIADNDPATAPGAEVVLPEAAPPPKECFLDGSCSGCLVWDPFYTDVRFADGTRNNNQAQLRMTTAIGTNDEAFYWYMGDNLLTVYLLPEQVPVLHVRRRVTPTLPALTIIGPDTVRLPACQDMLRVPLTLSQGDYFCADLDYQRINADFGGISERYIEARGSEIEYEMQISAPGNYPLSFEYNDIFGQTTTVSKTIVVVAIPEDLPPVVELTAAPDTVYFSSCEPGLVHYQFAIRDDCTPINLNQVYILSNHPALPYTLGTGLPRLPASTANHQQFSVEALLTQAGVYNIQIGYGGQVTTKQLVVIEKPAEMLRLAWPLAEDTLHYSLFYDQSACDSCGLWVGELVLDVPCGGISADYFSFDLDGEPFSPLVEIGLEDLSPGSISLLIYNRICPAQTSATTLNIRCEIPDGATYTFSRALSLSFPYEYTSAPIISKPHHTQVFNLNTCTDQPATAWLGTGLVGPCYEQAGVTEIAPAGLNIIRIGASLSLLRSAEAGAYTIELEVSEGSEVLARDSVQVVVVESVSSPVDCPSEVVFALPENGLGQLTPADILGQEAICFSSNDYVLAVQDSQPDNGGQIDACGTYPFALYAAATMPTTGLTGILAPEHWAVWRNSLAEVAFDAEAITISKASAALAYTFAADGSLAFTYEIVPSSSQHSWQLRLYDVAGQLIDAWEDQLEGTVNRSVAAGQTLVISLIGYYHDSSIFSNWQFTPTNPGAPICTGMVIAEDTTPPTTALVEEAEVVLDPLGLAQLATPQLDAGSADNCSPVSQQVRRQYTRDPLSCAPVAPYYGPWGETVDFDCCDACEEVVVEVRSLDDTGLESTASTSVFVRDDRQPIITAFDIEPACCPNPEACQGAFQYSFRVEAACSVRRPAISVALDLNADGSPDADLTAVTVPQPNNRYKITGWVAPEGQHALLLRAVDGCGNITTATVPFQVLDCSGGAPPIIMLSGGGQGLPEGIDQPLLLPGEPNPFVDQTTIRYWLPAEGEVQLRVVDANGRQVLRRASAHDAGWQSHLLTASELPAAGIYTLELYYHGQVLRQRVARL